MACVIFLSNAYWMFMATLTVHGSLYMQDYGVLKQQKGNIKYFLQHGACSYSFILTAHMLCTYCMDTCILFRLLPRLSPAQSAAREPVSVRSSAQTLCNVSLVMGHELWIRFIHSHGNMHKFACEISGSSLTSNQGHDGWQKNVM